MNLTLAIIVFVCHRPCCVWGRRETEMEGLDGQTNWLREKLSFFAKWYKAFQHELMGIFINRAGSGFVSRSGRGFWKCFINSFTRPVSNRNAWIELFLWILYLIILGWLPNRPFSEFLNFQLKLMLNWSKFRIKAEKMVKLYKLRHLSRKWYHWF